MKGFNFKLEGLKKLREFKEHESKIHLGIINREIWAVKNKIQSLHDALNQSYESQSELALSGVSGRSIQFYPYYNDGIRAHIESLENELFSLNNEYSEKVEELHERRGQTKLITNLKDKKFKEFKQKQMRKLEKEIQDLNNISKGGIKEEE